MTRQATGTAENFAATARPRAAPKAPRFRVTDYAVLLKPRVMSLVVFTALVGRMYQLQVLESDRYKLQSDDNRINVRLLPPPRGRIFDRFGTLLAGNRENYQVLVVAENTPDIERTLAALGRLIGSRTLFF